MILTDAVEGVHKCGCINQDKPSDQILVNENPVLSNWMLNATCGWMWNIFEHFLLFLTEYCSVRLILLFYTCHQLLNGSYIQLISSASQPDKSPPRTALCYLLTAFISVRSSLFISTHFLLFVCNKTTYCSCVLKTWVVTIAAISSCPRRQTLRRKKNWMYLFFNEQVRQWQKEPTSWKTKRLFP